MKVYLTKEAMRDIDSITDWYEGKREGLGLEFSGRVRDAIEDIKRHPLIYAPVVHDARRVQLEQFRDYGLWFQVRAAHSLVIACVSSRRKPEIVREIVRGVRPIKPQP